jgi:hypothetical protein
MAYDLNKQFNTESFRAASVIGFGMAVQLNTGSAFSVVPASGASLGIAPVYGIAAATCASVGISFPVQTGGWAKAIAGASLGIGAYVGAGIGTSALVPVGASGALAASSLLKFAIGVSLEAAAAGALFTVSIKPIEVV